MTTLCAGAAPRGQRVRSGEVQEWAKTRRGGVSLGGPATVEPSYQLYRCINTYHFSVYNLARLPTALA
ncbi:hypothetical protein FRC19_002897 [Serendipita sp. 401]|nr:hypothetical protein FRC15_002573 [Serendipita sp. 397]KAG8812782.1 hypothetical protein FRC19_002897 [Serendipita sp. 401]